ncbi:MAG: hypothetical protein K0R54_1718 [Clostridiaceae bacterium]|nr:hypothetical protein [Clostridiaceae bacterium]
MQEKNKLCCEDHMDIAFDNFLAENETFPYIEAANHEKCSYCEKEAKYILKLLKDNGPSELF